MTYVVDLLKDPQHRHLVLQELQEFAPITNPAVGERPLEDLRHALRRDPRILAALAPVGRINRFDLPMTEELY